MTQFPVAKSLQLIWRSDGCAIFKWVALFWQAPFVKIMAWHWYGTKPVSQTTLTTTNQVLRWHRSDIFEFIWVLCNYQAECLCSHLSLRTSACAIFCLSTCALNKHYQHIKRVNRSKRNQRSESNNTSTSTRWFISDKPNFGQCLQGSLNKGHGPFIHHNSNSIQILFALVQILHKYSALPNKHTIMLINFCKIGNAVLLLLGAVW